MAQKKIPMRMCTGCREMKPKVELIRVVKTPENEILLDTTGKSNGRGAYVCKNAECLRRAQKARALSNAFAIQVSDEVYARLGEEIERLE